MVAAVHMGKMTGEERWRGLFEVQAARLLAELEDTRKVHFGPRIFTAPETAFSDPSTASPATSSRYCSDGIG
jgi:hypothetical protein